MNVFVNHNGKIIGADQPLITAANRGFRFGDGLFETMKISEDRIALASLHFERLFGGMQLLDFDIPKHLTPAFFLEQIAALCKKNGHVHTARVRLTVFRDSGELFDAASTLPQHIIETFALQNTGSLNENGLILGMYEDARKAPGKFSHIKSNNYLPYAMAARHAKKQRWNDCLLLNTDGNICESSIANVFIIKGDIISTPSLQQGCVAGVMRRYLLEKLSGLDYKVQETVLTTAMVKEADEVFLTNAVRGIQWVKQLEDTLYTNKMVKHIYHTIIK